jgi:hypothetical protein
MRDCRTSLITALITAINGQSTGLTAYTKIPKGDFSNPISYPFYHITNITDVEDGPKAQFMYSYELDIETVYANLTDKAVMWGVADSIKQLFCNGSPFALTGGFDIMQALLIDTVETEDLLNSQEVDTTTIRMRFEIQDNN